MRDKKGDKIVVLSKDYDLSQGSDLELVATLKKLCDEYEMCRYCLSTATLDVWHGIVRVAKEIIKRETCSNSRDLIELAALVAAELGYPEKWDTAVYTTVWEALWEDYSWLKAKVEKLEKEIEENERSDNNKDSSPFFSPLNGQTDDMRLPPPFSLSSQLPLFPL